MSRESIRLGWLVRRWFCLCLCLVACRGKGEHTPALDEHVAVDPVGERSAPLPLDPAVRRGQLHNGLTYFLREHGSPDDRVSLRLVVRAGSLLEDEDQRGLAHFVEHMAFQGTERFDEDELIEVLERAGMRIGPDANAQTSYEGTVYQLSIPSGDPALVDTGIELLVDWAGAIRFDPEQLDKERGVIIEEWRLAQGVAKRVEDQEITVAMAGSRHAVRHPLGHPSALETASVETLERFYRDWYRPDLMAVIAVGPIDIDAMERTIAQAVRVAEGSLRSPPPTRVRGALDRAHAGGHDRGSRVDGPDTHAVVPSSAWTARKRGRLSQRTARRSDRPSVRGSVVRGVRPGRHVARRCHPPRRSARPRDRGVQGGCSGQTRRTRRSAAAAHRRARTAAPIRIRGHRTRARQGCSGWSKRFEPGESRPVSSPPPAANTDARSKPGWATTRIG